MRTYYKKYSKLKNNGLYTLDYRLRFGKYIGSTIKLLIEHSTVTRSYIVWTKNNIKGFILDIEAERYLKKYSDAFD